MGKNLDLEKPKGYLSQEGFMFQKIVNPFKKTSNT